MRIMKLISIMLACVPLLSFASQTTPKNQQTPRRPLSRSASPTATANLHTEVRVQAEELRDAYLRLSAHPKAPSKKFALAIIAENTDRQDMWETGVHCMRDAFETNPTLSVLATNHRSRRKEMLQPEALEAEHKEHFRRVSTRLLTLMDATDDKTPYINVGAIAEPILEFYAPDALHSIRNKHADKTRSPDIVARRLAQSRKDRKSCGKQHSPGKHWSDYWSKDTLKIGIIGAIMGIGFYEAAKRWFNYR